MNKLILLLTGLIAWCSALGVENGTIINCFYVDGRLLRSHAELNRCTRFTAFMYIGYKGDKSFIINRFSLEYRKYRANNTFFAGILLSTDIFNPMMDDEARANFVNTVFEAVNGEFNGVDLILNFVKQYEVETQANSTLVKLIKEMSKKLNSHNLKLSISVEAGAGTKHMNFHIPSIINHVSFINVNAYGFAEYSGNKLTYNSPNRGQGENNTRAVIIDLIKKGIPPKKMVLGIPFISIPQMLLNPKQFKLGSSIDRSLGYLNYNQFCKLKNDLNYSYDSAYDTAVLLNRRTFYSYDNVQSIEKKVRFGKCVGLAGFSAMFIDSDDYKGRCGEEYPLFNALYNKVNEPL